MKISELLQENKPRQVKRVSSAEVVMTDPDSGIETTYPTKAKEPGTIKRDKKGKLVADPDTRGGIATDIKPGEEIRIEPGSAEGTEGQGA